MRLKKVLIAAVLFLTMNAIAQNSATEITTKDGVHYITNSIDYPVAGTYFFKGADPIVELNSNGTGFYQQHEEPKKAMIWGLECSKDGVLKFTKGFDSVEYILYYKYTSSTETEEEWNKVEFSIHLNSMKMFINGERMKTFTAKVEK
jgi:hypothetical protein